eukprot:SAG11_NODE_3401_length_2468_cov_1.688054_3_plen_71_part_00
MRPHHQDIAAGAGAEYGDRCLQEREVRADQDGEPNFAQRMAHGRCARTLCDALFMLIQDRAHAVALRGDG